MLPHIAAEAYYKQVSTQLLDPLARYPGRREPKTNPLWIQHHIQDQPGLAHFPVNFQNQIFTGTRRGTSRRTQYEKHFMKNHPYLRK